MNPVSRMSESVGKKDHDAEVSKPPYMLVVVSKPSVGLRARRRD